MTEWDVKYHDIKGPLHYHAEIERLTLGWETAFNIGVSEQEQNKKLRAEIERLNAKVDNWADINAAAGREIERLTKELEIWKRNGGDILLRAEIERQQADIDKLMSERDGWLQEIERLLDALKTIECHSIDHTDACRMAGKARAALEPKP